MSILLSMMFLAVTLLFGFAVSFWGVGERRIFGLLALVPVIGINAYVFFVNVISYVVPVRVTFWLVIALMLVSSFFLYAYRSRNSVQGGGPDISRRELWILVASAFLIASASGIVALRTLLPDDRFPAHLPLVSTISAGNFPVMDPSEPDYPIAYHYGPDLLAAAFQNIAGIPGWIGYDIQTIIFSGSTLFAAFLLAFYLTRKYWPSFIASLLLMYGGGLAWLNGFQGAAPLWQKFVGEEVVASPWKFLAPTTISNFDSSIATSVNHTTVMGFGVMILAIYFYFLALEAEGRKKIYLSILTGILFGYLTLSLETNFAILAFAFLIGLLVFLLRGASWSLNPPARVGLFLTTALILGIGIVLALTQGGFVSTLGTSGEGESFVLVKNFWTSDITDKHILPFRLKFFLEFGLPLVLFIPAVIFFRRDRRVLFLATIALGAFATPLIVHYAPSPQNMERLFALSTPLFSFIGGMYLGELALRMDAYSGRSVSKYLILAIIGTMMLTAVLFQLVHMITPFGYLGDFSRPFFDTPRTPASIDQKAYDWIRMNTTIKDRFFPYSSDFMLQTGRFTPGPGPFNWGIHVRGIYREALEACSPSAFAKLGVRYLFVSSNFPIQDFESSCREKLYAELVFQIEAGNDRQKIYRLPPVLKR